MKHEIDGEIETRYLNATNNPEFNFFSFSDTPWQG